jgi:hypothetical protein
MFVCSKIPLGTKNSYAQQQKKHIESRRQLAEVVQFSLHIRFRDRSINEGDIQ